MGVNKHKIQNAELPTKRAAQHFGFYVYLAWAADALQKYVSLGDNKKASCPNGKLRLSVLQNPCDHGTLKLDRTGSPHRLSD